MITLIKSFDFSFYCPINSILSFRREGVLVLLLIIIINNSQIVDKFSVKIKQNQIKSCLEILFNSLLTVKDVYR